MKNNFNRGELNSLKAIKKNSGNLASINRKDSKGAKIQNMGKLLVDKIDDILGNYNTATASTVTSGPESISSNYRSNLYEEEKRDKVASLPSKDQEKKKKKKLAKIGEKDTFMTDVGIEGETKVQSKYIQENDKKIRDMLNEIDDIDKLLQDDEEKEYLAENPEHRGEVEYFKNLIAEVDSYKRNMKEELDELQYLIKFVDQTKGRINRHKYGVSNMFKETGLQANNKNKLEESDPEDSDEHVYYNQAGMYDKTKNLSKIKNNLFNLQGNVLNYYHNFNDKMKKIEKSNKEHIVINKEVRDKIGRPGSSSAKLVGKSKLNK
jgi:hypothetical protein